MPFMVNGNMSSVKFPALSSKIRKLNGGVGGGDECRTDSSYSETQIRWDCTDFVICFVFLTKPRHIYNKSNVGYAPRESMRRERAVVLGL